LYSRCLFHALFCSAGEVLPDGDLSAVPRAGFRSNDLFFRGEAAGATDDAEESDEGEETETLNRWRLWQSTIIGGGTEEGTTEDDDEDRESSLEGLRREICNFVLGPNDETEVTCSSVAVNFFQNLLP